MPKTFLLPPTENAVDVLKKALQHGIPVYDDLQHRCLKIQHVYRQLEQEDESASRARLHQYQHNEIHLRVELNFKKALQPAAWGPCTERFHTSTCNKSE